jgi:CubicO group peptidase (beta-lactamase class C family)
MVLGLAQSWFRYPAILRFTHIGILYLYIVLPSDLLAQKNTVIAQIDSVVAGYMQQNKMVGLSVGIVKDGKIYLDKGYGFAEVDQPAKVDSLTNFLTCSVTKLFTATAIMQLVEQGKLDIHQKIGYYLPEFIMKDVRCADITILQMLTHTSGLYWDKELKHSPNDSTALRKFAYSFNKEKLAFAPGTKFNPVETYSNTAFDLLGFLVQKTSGQLYADYICEHVLLKAGMYNSSIELKHIAESRRSSPHILRSKKPVVGGILIENTEHNPSGNLNSCTNDLCTWMLNVLALSNGNETQGILKKSTLDSMWTPKRVAPQNKNVSIGLGWWIKDTKSFGKSYWHVGNNPGYSATVIVFPDINVGIAILSNGMYAEDVVWNKIPDAILNLIK